MKLDDLKAVIDQEKDIMEKTKTSSIDSINKELFRFNKEINRNTLIETIVATFAFCAVSLMLLYDDTFYPYVIGQIFPNVTAEKQVSMNTSMYFSLVVMAIYCLFVPFKLAMAQRDIDSLDWTLSSRVNQEIGKLEKQSKLWSSAHLWSFAPAIIIGVSFFWGLQVSLTGHWFPSDYLMLYFVFIFLTTMSGLKRKKMLLERRITPMLKRLYGIRKEILG